MESQPGEEVTLFCSNFTRFPFHIYWFKLSNSSNNSCISSMMSSDGNTSFCDGFQNGKFNMSSNTTTLFLRIKQLELSDSGLYFCGLYSNRNSAIVSTTYLKVQGKSCLSFEKLICLPTRDEIFLKSFIQSSLL